jgi:hypothetical protein
MIALAGIRLGGRALGRVRDPSLDGIRYPAKRPA